MKRSVSIALLLISLPVFAVMLEAASYYFVNRHTGSIVSSGVRREFVLHVPPGYDATRATPLVISLHGAGMWGAAQMDTSRWNPVADREGFIVVYPSGTAGDGPRVWEPEPERAMSGDVRFIADLIDELQRTYNIDASRIYANGLSNGGGMSYVLSCLLSDRIAAVGLVAPALTATLPWCDDRPPVPAITFVGTADAFTPYRGGKSVVAPRPFPDIPAFIASWAARNRCDATAVESAVAPDVTRLEYQHCANDAEVLLYTIHGGGHTWPGGGHLPEWAVGPTNRHIDASSEMWAFFRRHPLQK
jgi:polyhydroxybutyrate depolymerase